jgi:DNA-binding MarR family transcriptional regulator
MMETSSPAIGDGCRKAVQPPWEPLNRLHDRDERFATSSSLRLAPSGGRRPIQGRPSPTTIGEKSGLSRRGTIYEYIRAHPGAHVRGIANDLGFATGDLQYHLSWLERHGYVETRKNGFYRFVYPSKMFSEKQEVLLGVLSQETPREILLSLLLEASVNQGELAKSLACSQPTISWHMERLVGLGVVSRKRTSNGLAYDVVADNEEILRFVKEYHPTVWGRWAEKLTDVMVNAGNENAKEGNVSRVGLIRPALVELIGRS